MKLLLTIIFFTPFFYSAIAQQKNEDIIYVKGGYVVQGAILEKVPGVSVKIRTKDNVTYQYNYDQIDSIKGNPGNLFHNTNVSSSKNDTVSPKASVQGGGARYLFILEPGAAVALAKGGDETLIGAQMVNGALVSPYFSIGFGIGIDKSTYTTSVPLFLDLRGYFANLQGCPYFGIGIGYASQSGSTYTGGLYLNPTFGIRAAIARNTYFLFNLGLKLEQMQYSSPAYNLSYSQSQSLFNVKIGILL